MDTRSDDASWMNLAYQEAQKAFAMGETPVGAVIVFQDRVIAAAHNLRETQKDPTAHAELLAIQEASRIRGGWRLFGCTLYVTVEPCPMCAGAMLMSRIDRLVFGVRDPKAGVAGSLYNLVQDPRFNHRLEVTEGIMAEECGAILTDFFTKLRDLRRDGRVVDCARLESE